MNKRILSLLLSAALIIGIFSGCNPKVTQKGKEQAQLVVAINPTIVYDDSSYNLAFNDIKNAIYKDRSSASLTSLSQTTSWNWVYATGENWQKRAVYDVAKWQNGFGALSKNNNAYFFNADSSISLFSYTKKVSKLSTYNNDEISDYGLVLSATGTKEEAICYEVEKDGNISILSGAVTALEKVDDVKTGFLSEDGTKRSAAVRIRINDRVFWSDSLVNTTASENGTAVTQITYPDISDIPVTQGDLVFISVQLNATVNRVEDITLPDKDDIEEDIEDNTSSDIDDDNDLSSSTVQAGKVEGYSVIDGYESRFTLVYPFGADEDTTEIVNNTKKRLEKTHKAEQFCRNDGSDPVEYEILVGITNREESKTVYDELINARINHASDFIVRLINKKVVIVASTTQSLQTAVDYFIDNYVKDDESVIPYNLNYIFREKKNPISLNGQNIAAFTILIEKYPSYMTLTAANELRDFIINRTGYVVPIEKGTTNNPSVIQVGPRSGSNMLLSDESNYEIKFDGTKLCFVTGSSTAVNYAVKQFITDVKNGAKITDKYAIKGTYKSKDYSLTSNYALVWNDEFTGDYFKNGDTVDRNKWRASTEDADGPWYKLDDKILDLINKGIGGPWYYHGDNIPNVTGDEVPEGYVQQGIVKRSNAEGEHFYLKDNELVQVVKRTAEGFTGNRMISQNTMQFRYGFVEIRNKYATNNGASSSLWLVGNRGEIDICENYGQDRFSSALHSWLPGNHISHMLNGDAPLIYNYPAEGEHLYDTYHHYAFEWDENRLAYYFDGVKYLEVDMTDEYWNSFEEYVHIRLNCCVGGDNYAKGYNPTDYLGENVDDFYEEQHIDFVRVYQKNDATYKLKAK